MMLAGIGWCRLLLSLFLCASSVSFAEMLTTAWPQAALAQAEATAERAANALPVNSPRPLKIGVNFVLNSISKINEGLGEFEASIDLQLRWRDASLAFDPKSTGTNRLAYGFEQATAKVDQIWSPPIDIVNMKGKPIFLEPSLMMYSDGTVMYIQRIKAVFESKFKLAPFPFDTQHLKVQLLSNRYNTADIQFVQNQSEINHSGLRPGAHVVGWHLKEVEFIPSSIRGWNGDTLPRFEASIIMSREPITHLFVFAPLLLILIVPTILTLYVPGEVGVRLTTWSGAMLALIAMIFTLDLRYPALESDSILSQMIAILFGYQFLMMCLTMTVLNPHLAEKVKNPFIISEVIKFLRWSVPAGLAILITIRILLTAL